MSSRRRVRLGGDPAVDIRAQVVAYPEHVLATQTVQDGKCMPRDCAIEVSDTYFLGYRRHVEAALEFDEPVWQYLPAALQAHPSFVPRETLRVTRGRDRLRAVRTYMMLCTSVNA
jgi:hypothetical protein